MPVWTPPATLVPSMAAGRAVTSEKSQADAENIEAFAEQVTGAPKMRRVNMVGSSFTGLGDFSGVEFHVFANNNGGSSANVNFQYSTNGGSTWSTAQVLATMSPSNGAVHGAGFFDFASGAIGFSGAAENGDATEVSATMAGASLAIDAVRFVPPVSGLITAILRPCGATI
jgi:hypothetical protein